jgi:hypothetical protein
VVASRFWERRHLLAIVLFYWKQCVGQLFNGFVFLAMLHLDRAVSWPAMHDVQNLAST